MQFLFTYGGMTPFFKKSHRFVVGYYNLLLVLLVFLFIFRPYERSAVYLGFWKLLLAFALVSAIFNVNHKRKVKILAMGLAVPAVLFSWINLADNNEYVFVANALFTIAFLLLCAASIIYDVVLKARVTVETLKGVVCAYFLVAFLFAYIYYLIAYSDPTAFNFVSKQVSVFFYTHYLSEMLYFSFVTLLTIGYGDITAASEVGQTVAVIEGIFGQFYIAILVSRLVSVYSFYSDKRLVQRLETDMGIKK